MANTPYDVFRTLLTDCTELIILVVNEIFHTNYTGKEKIYLLQNEHFVEMPNGSEQERITDSSFEIQNDLRKRYHIECQSTEDGSIIVRMFEYDTQIALENRELSSDTLMVNFPNSAIVSLRHTKNTPKVMTIRVNTPGGAVSYIVPVFLDMSRKVIENLAVKYENVAKGVCRQMGGKVLNFANGKKYFRCSRTNGTIRRNGHGTGTDCRRLIIRQIKMIEDKRTRRVAHSYKSKTRLGGFCYRTYTINKDICQSFLKLTFLLNPDFFRVANRAHGRHAV